MFSRILLKLIDESIVPALLLLGTRMVSVMLVARYFNIPFEIGTNGFAFRTENAYVMVNSYSTFYMIVVLTIGLLFILAKALLFHDSHITPGLTAKVYSANMNPIIQSGYNIYSQAAIWLSYSYLLLFVTGFMSLFNLLYAWVFYVALALCVLSTLFMIIDIEHEIRINKQTARPKKYEVYYEEEEQ